MISSRRHRVRTAIAAMAGICLSILASAAAWSQATKAATRPLSAEAWAHASEQIAALMHEKTLRTPAQNKMDSHLIAGVRQLKTGVAFAAAPRLRPQLKLRADRTVELDVKGTVTPAMLADVVARGGSVVNSHPELHAVRITLPPAAIEDFAARPDVRFVGPAVYGQPNTGNVEDEGDYTHQAIQARSNFSVTGSGVTVGVMSDSLDDDKGSLQGAINSGDLDPNNTTYITGQQGTGEGEGLAMLEVVHDLAPGAKLIFATCNPSAAQMAANIRALGNAGCDIIVDDYSFPTEAPFQDDVIAQAVNDVTAKGILYFSCARNSGNYDQGTSSVWQGDFLNGGDASGLDLHSGSLFHSWDGSTVFNQILPNQGGGINLFWNDPLGQADDDYDLYEVDSDQNIVDYSGNTQNGTQDPYESIDSATDGDYVVVVKYSGAARFLYVDVGRKHLDIATPGAVRGHNAQEAALSFCVGATPANTAFDSGQPTGPYPNPFTASNVTETFSCDGPRRMFFKPDGTPYSSNLTSTGGLLLAKPDFLAADGTSTTLPQGQGLNPFFGTSNAAPHAAALCALLLAKYPSLTPAQAAAKMRSGALQIVNHGTGNRDSGTGILMAPLILQASTSKPAITSSLAATATVGVAFSYQITASNSPTSFGTSGLPSGLGTSSSSGKIIGTPTTAGTYNVTLQATNSAGTGTAVLKLTVNGSSKPVVTSASTVSGNVGKAFVYQITATNSPTSYGAANLPPGLSIVQSTGKISGTPTKTGTSTATIAAFNASGSGSKTLTITINAAAPAITSATSATATVNKAFSYQITASNSPTSYGAAGLPSGLSIDQSTGKISGTPTKTGTYSVTIAAFNAAGHGSATLSLTVKVPAPVITSPTSASATVNKAFSYQITAANTPTSYGASGLPSGLSINQTTGKISGTPTKTGTYSVTIAAFNTGGNGTAKLTLTVK